MRRSLWNDVRVESRLDIGNSLQIGRIYGSEQDLLIVCVVSRRSLLIFVRWENYRSTDSLFESPNRNKVQTRAPGFKFLGFVGSGTNRTRFSAPVQPIVAWLEYS